MPVYFLTLWPKIFMFHDLHQRQTFLGVEYLANLCIRSPHACVDLFLLSNFGFLPTLRSLGLGHSNHFWQKEIYKRSSFVNRLRTPRAHINQIPWHFVQFDVKTLRPVDFSHSSLRVSLKQWVCTTCIEGLSNCTVPSFILSTIFFSTLLSRSASCKSKNEYVYSELHELEAVMTTRSHRNEDQWGQPLLAASLSKICIKR